ncbi:hypothetical protein B0H13DRAFT_2305468 [Mycena leptocephala]|nr:hypothetical protein B0H13DRAFT_2305468 [Mycena leptocephala]
MPRLTTRPDQYSADDTLQDVFCPAACLLVYEWVTSLDDGISHVWSLKWRLPKLIFVLNRYIIRVLLVCLWIVADLPGTNKVCHIYGYVQIIPLALAILVTQALIVIRVWVIFIILLITLAKVVRRDAGVLGSGYPPTLKILARDSVVYFAFIFAFTLANAIIYSLESTRYDRSILLAPTSTIPSKVSRMMLNRRPPCESPSSLDLSSTLEIGISDDPIDSEE